ncbi:MAG: DUF3352 domain-containing protein [Bacteroidales bacterium]|nr:DUF3352 domain-containing protein [Bacteroidales bacterium]
MKKFLAFLVVIILLGFFVYKFILTPGENYRSIYLVPENAAVIIETDNAMDAWQKIVHSNAWDLLHQNPALYKLDTTISLIDSLINSKRFLLKAFGARKILVTLHPVSTNRFENLYIITINKVSKLKNIDALLPKILSDNYTVTQRKFNNQEIYELYAKKINEVFYFSIIKDQLVISTAPQLIEASVNQMNNMTFGRDLNFLDVYKRVSGKGLFSVYLIYKYFDQYIHSVTGKSNPFISELKNDLYYTGLFFDINNTGSISLEGYTSVNDSSTSYLMPVLHSGKGKHEIAQVIPNQVASVVSIGFDNVESLFTDVQQTSGEEFSSTFEKYVSRIEKKIKINFAKNFLSWIDNEIALVQTQPSNLGKNNEFAAVIKAKNKNSARKNLDFITAQLEKNAPVKFKEIDYNGYSIKYLSVPGLFKFFFGKMLEKIDKPYYTIIDNFVVFSNHPQILKNFIDDFNAGNTLASNVEYYNFSKAFSQKSKLMTYFQTPVLFQNLKEYLDESSWNKMLLNKKYITSFPRLGFQIDDEDQLISMFFTAEFLESTEDFIPAKYTIDIISPEIPVIIDTLAENLEMEPEITESEFYINDLDAGKYEERFENGELKISVSLKNGKKHGNFKEFYENGQLKIRGKYSHDKKTGIWKYYDDKGNLANEKDFDSKDE